MRLKSWGFIILFLIFDKFYPGRGASGWRSDSRVYGNFANFLIKMTVKDEVQLTKIIPNLRLNQHFRTFQ